MADLDVLEATRDAFNARHKPGDRVKARTANPNVQRQKRPPKGWRVVAARGAFIDGDQVWVELEPKGGQLSNLLVRSIEWNM